MEIQSLHKYLSLNNLASGHVEAIFAGQPCIHVTKQPQEQYTWAINPVFAKLTYGANAMSDIPYCMEPLGSMEEAVADGLVKLHEVGAFNTEVDLPEDSYAATMNTMTDEYAKDAIKESADIFGAAMIYRKKMRLLEAFSYKPVIKNDTPEEAAKSDSDHEKWRSDVLSAHPDKKLKFFGRIENGKNMISAEISGKKDRSYGVWDVDANQGHVFSNEGIEPVGTLDTDSIQIHERELTDSEKDKREEIVLALKKDKKFVAKYGSDGVYVVATAKAKE